VAKPDGYTLGCLTPHALTLQPHLNPVPYKGPDDFDYVIGVMITTPPFIVRGDAPWKTMKELVDYARANPGKVEWAPPGPEALHISFLRT